MGGYIFCASERQLAALKTGHSRMLLGCPQSGLPVSREIGIIVYKLGLLWSFIRVDPIFFNGGPASLWGWGDIGPPRGHKGVREISEFYAYRDKIRG